MFKSLISGSSSWSCRCSFVTKMVVVVAGRKKGGILLE